MRRLKLALVAALAGTAGYCAANAPAFAERPDVCAMLLLPPHPTEPLPMNRQNGIDKYRNPTT